MLMTSQLKVGTAFMYEGNALIVQKMLGQRSGRAGMVTSFRVKNLVTNSTMDLGIDAGEKFDEVDLDSHTTKLSYIDGDTFVFMDQDTYEQFELAKDDLGDYAGYITPDDDLEISLTFYEGKPVGIDLPVRVTRTVTYCEPGVKGDTSGKTTDQIAAAINRHGWHIRKDGKPVTSAQVYAVICRYPSIFTKEEGRIRVML